MKMKIVYTFQAQQDLKNIYEYIAYSLLVPDTARNMSRQIMQSVRSLETMPERNPLYKEAVSIARILYGGMDINRQLEETIDF